MAQENKLSENIIRFQFRFKYLAELPIVFMDDTQIEYVWQSIL